MSHWHPEARTRTEARALADVDTTDGLPVECRRYWLGRLILSPRRGIDGEVIRVLRCEHRQLCDGVALKITWYDGIVSYHCSYDVVEEDGEDRLID